MPSAPKPPSAAVPPAPVLKPASTTSPVSPLAPAAVKPLVPAQAASSSEPKKETAKITLPSAPRTVPQATVNLKAAPVSGVAPAASKPAAPASAAPATETQAAESPIFAIAAAVVAFLSLGVQVWTMIG